MGGATAALTALLIVRTSDDARLTEFYQPRQVYGALTIGAMSGTGEEMPLLREAAAKAVPGVSLVEVYTGVDGGSAEVMPLSCGDEEDCGDGYWDTRIGGQDVLRYLTGREDPAAAALAAGKAVVFRPGAVREGMVTLGVWKGEDEPRFQRTSVPAIEVKPLQPGVGDALLPVRLVEDLGLRPLLTQLVIDPARHRVTVAEEERIRQGVAAVTSLAEVRVERGPERPVDIVFLLVFAGAIILVLGGTFAATGLAAADSRPDIATLAAIGAAPGIRRLVTMGQAWFIAATGVTLGAAVGFVPGLAKVWESTPDLVRVTGGTSDDVVASGSAIIVIPWLALAALVVLLPLLAGLVAGAFARAPVMVTRRAR
ncbi:hypothetical protein AB0B89_17250 [Sphaerisporangium sp. NPDC049002]|uniref:hypothetical protein n=1 Tax=Sphaerisporangium sp. NPDC049002 TaxID=3155392 RepID=UPI0033F4FFCF